MPRLPLLFLLLTVSIPAMAIDTLKEALGIRATQFEWSASSSAPDGFPMKIIAANLNYRGGGQYVGASAQTDNGWGKPDSGSGGGKQPVPEILDILFFSYTENQFYRGTFDLPRETILKLLQEGYFSPTPPARHVTYRNFVVGVAPGGVVAVWVLGRDRQTEVFYGKAIKVNLPWDTLTKATHITREQYVREAIEDSIKSPEVIAALKKNGPPLGLWDRYRKRYRWQPVLTNMVLRDNLFKVVSYFNGEHDYLTYPLDEAGAAASRPVPKEMSFVLLPPGAAKGRLVELYFNEAEILDAFEKLGSSNQALKLEFRVALVNNKYDLTVWVRNDKDEIQLKQTKHSVYGT